MLKTILHHFKAPLFLSMLSLIVMTQSCKKTDLQQEQEESVSSQRIEELRSSVASSTGAPLSEVQYDAAKKSFVVAKDAMISLEDAQGRFPESANVRPGSNGSQQRVYTYTVARTNASNISFYADASVPAEWLTALDQAIANWNSTNSLISMKRVTGTTTTTTSGPKKGKKPGTTTTTTSTPSYNVLVTTMYDNATSTVAQAYYPSYSGGAGFQVTINTYYNYLSSSYKTFAVTHELGHTIGLTHTDQTYGNLIPGTPTTDPNSVMNSFVLPWAGFTNYDVVAVNTVYPK
jgi:hypothetical protein